MIGRKIIKYLLLSVALVSLVFGGLSKTQESAAMPGSPVDESKVPHYFGPYPNWANSPMTVSNVQVSITDPGGVGTGATASATVDGLGQVTSLTITSPGFGYTAADVAITGSGTGATASATVSTAGSVVSVVVNNGGAGYTTPSVAFSGGGVLGLPPAITKTASGEYIVSVGSATGGTFTLTVDGQKTAAIPYNANPASIQKALAALKTPIKADAISAASDKALSFATAPTIVTIDGSNLILPDAVQATGTAYGGVDTVTLTNPGTGYQLPTVDFDMPLDPAGVQARGHVLCVEPNCIPVAPATTVTITGIAIDYPGSGYAWAPGVAIRDGTLFDPTPGGGSGATATATIAIQEIKLDTFGDGYTSAPDVTITDPGGAGSGALATATINVGAVNSITLLTPGSGYITTGGIKKFQDGLPQLCIPTANFAECDALNNNLGQHIPIALPDTTTFPGADYYVIALVQHREWMNSSLPATGTLVREYVQLQTTQNASWSKSVALQTSLLDGTTTPTLMPDGSQAIAVDDPHWLGPVIVASKDRPVRITFYNLLPAGVAGDLFIPVDSTYMGSGMGPSGMPDPMDQGSVMDMVRNPMCSEKYADPMYRDMCFTENRATLHLHGGVSPWISDGTPHQWITPAQETTNPWPQGVSVASVPDMVGQAAIDKGIPDCSAANDGCMTFYYTNQQSARLMFYHDHAWGITRLNVYAGEAAGYVITDPTEQALFGPGAPYESMGEGIPLIIQDRTFVPDATQLAAQDPTWDTSRWGGYGSFWYQHVYMPAQNPGDPTGWSAYGRWFYGPWFWPPNNPVHGQIPNPYYNMDPATGFTTPLATPCNLDDPTTWQYQVSPYCEPQYIPGTPNNSAGMEQFNDTPMVNGTAYPTVTLDPKSYRLRILNAANDRFWNLQWYIADPSTGTDSEVALDPALVAAAQLDPVVFPVALKSMVWNGVTYDLRGPDWIQIATEGGFLPAPVLIDGQQETTWITDPTRFDVGNVDLHSLVLAPAERADVIVDFSQFAGKTLILYNDAPAAYPARVPSYDYYTGYPDQYPNGPSSILPGYGPNTRTIMQVKINNVAPAPAFNFTALYNRFTHKANGTGVFEAGQHPIIVGQAAYNSAYGTNFAGTSWCNAPGAPLNRCDGFARISDQGGMELGFNTLLSPNTRVSIPIQPKALHDETNAVAFDEFGRMSANIGLEAVPATPALQNVTLFPYVNPATEFIDGTNLPHGDVKVTPIASMTDGTQIWKITHNGVDTHPIHFHLYDVQILNRVTWDNIILRPEGSELGWKDTIRVSPLQDTIVALRAVIPSVPFELPNSIRMLSPMMPAGSTAMFNNQDPNGNPTTPIVNQLVNFGWEYVWHCHILAHEEMDMMRPQSLVLPPLAPDGLAWSVVRAGGNRYTFSLNWNDNSINETEFIVQSSVDGGLTWVDVSTDPSPLNQPNTHGTRSFTDPNFQWSTTTVLYRVVASNTAGYGLEFPTLSAKSMSAPVAIINPPSNLTATLTNGPAVQLAFTDNTTNETGFIVERSLDGINFSLLATLPPHGIGGNNRVLYNDTAVTLGNTYTYRVAALVAPYQSPYSNLASILVAIPAAPSNVTVTAVRQGANERITVNWSDLSNNETGFQIQRATDSAFTNPTTVNVAANTTTWTSGNIARVAWYVRVRSVNILGQSVWVNATPFPIQPALLAVLNGAKP